MIVVAHAHLSIVHKLTRLTISSLMNLDVDQAFGDLKNLRLCSRQLLAPVLGCLLGMPNIDLLGASSDRHKQTILAELIEVYAMPLFADAWRSWSAI